MRVPVPATAGQYRALLFAVLATAEKAEKDVKPLFLEKGPETFCELIAESAGTRADDAYCAASLHAVQQALAAADQKQRLPVDYVDITQGFLAKAKRWIKRKLLGNFQHAYVDVLSRQQSAFNRQILTALQELAEGYALLDHVLAPGNLAHQLAEAQQRIAALEERLSRLEKRVDQGRLQDKGVSRDCF